MRTRLSLIMSLIAIVGIAAQAHSQPVQNQRDNPPKPHTKHILERFEVGKAAKLRIEAGIAKVRLEPGDARMLNCRGEIVSTLETGKLAEAAVNAVSIRYFPSPGRGVARLVVQMPKRPVENLREVTLNISVPAGLAIDLRASTGLTQITSLSTDEVSVESETGDIYLSGMSGAIRAESVTGRVDAMDVGGKVSLRTTTGTISILVRNGCTGSIEARTATGDLQVRCAEGRQANIFLESQYGWFLAPPRKDVRRPSPNQAIAVLGGGGCNIRAETVNGRAELVIANAEGL